MPLFFLQNIAEFDRNISRKREVISVIKDVFITLFALIGKVYIDCCFVLMGICYLIFSGISSVYCYLQDRLCAKYSL